MTQHAGRFPITLEQPTATNGNALHVKYNDDEGGVDYYDVTIAYETR